MSCTAKYLQKNANVQNNTIWGFGWISYFWYLSKIDQFSIHICSISFNSFHLFSTSFTFNFGPTLDFRSSPKCFFHHPPSMMTRQMTKNRFTCFFTTIPYCTWWLVRVLLRYRYHTAFKAHVVSLKKTYHTWRFFASCPPRVLYLASILFFPLPVSQQRALFCPCDAYCNTSGSCKNPCFRLHPTQPPSLQVCELHLTRDEMSPFVRSSRIGAMRQRLYVWLSAYVE